MASLSHLRAQVRALLAQHLAPREVFLGVLLGVIVGCSPLYGLHSVLCGLLAWRLRLNFAVLYAAASISIPPLIPPLGWVCVQAGEIVRHGQPLTLQRADFASARTPAGLHALASRFFVDWLIGGALVGLVLGAILGGLAAWVVAARQARRRRDEEAQPGGTAEVGAAGGGEPAA